MILIRTTAPILLCLLTGAFLGLLTGCDPYEEDSFREYVVVESHLIAGRQLPHVLLSTTRPIEQKYDFSEAAVSGANVSIQLLEEGGTDPELTVPYLMASPGVYVPGPGFRHRVQARRTYRLTASVPDHGEITGSTTVPDTFRVISPVPEEVTYQQDTLRISISSTTRIGRQNVFTFQAIASDPRYEELTPFYRNLVDDEINEIGDFTNNPSGLINEANFDISEDGEIELQYPWLGAAFYGENRIVANSLDRNLVDFVNSHEVQGGGSTLPPGEIPNAVYHIDGGIGVFGSMAADTITTRILRPQE